MSKQLPFKFPERYVYLQERLEGAQGYVYLCKDSYLDRTVAVKVVSTPATLNTLKQELAFLTSIRSPHIAEVYDLLEAASGKHIGLVEQYVSGKHLLDPTASVNETVFLRTLYQLASGLSDIHVAKKIHRDIKPSNIRFDEEGILKILDFGISAHADGEMLTSNGKGTLPYLAPELYVLPASYTEAVDVYAFGVIAHQLAFGTLSGALKTKPPLASGTQLEPFKQSQLGVPGEIAAILDLTLKKEANLRPRSAVLRETLGRRLAHALHRAAITYKGSATILNSKNKSVSLTFQDCTITITYDGLRFTISSVLGNIDINNVKAVVKQELPASCVITLNGSSGARDFITVDMSHPGLIL